jgi:hypothetical protein
MRGSVFEEVLEVEGDMVAMIMRHGVFHILSYHFLEEKYSLCLWPYVKQDTVSNYKFLTSLATVVTLDFLSPLKTFTLQFVPNQF